mmetsp:Transcript_12181/g.20406  ORF Transcript_12181/g.20406 Transcript_12181/m.20406 type:complete len:206 (+) Transcript_12181:414-1031(+)
MSSRSCGASTKACHHQCRSRQQQQQQQQQQHCEYRVAAIVASSPVHAATHATTLVVAIRSIVRRAATRRFAVVWRTRPAIATANLVVVGQPRSSPSCRCTRQSMARAEQRGGVSRSACLATRAQLRAAARARPVHRLHGPRLRTGALLSSCAICHFQGFIASKWHASFARFVVARQKVLICVSTHNENTFEKHTHIKCVVVFLPK